MSSQTTVKAAKAEVGAVPETMPASAQKPKRGALTAEQAALAPRVKELRDAGTAWWQIGFALDLPGSADTVVKGKGGAAFARKIYASGFGDVPRTQVRDGSRANREKNTDVKAIKSQRKMDRVATVRAGTAVVRESMEDDEIVDMLKGRVIGWYIDLADVSPGESMYSEHEAGVHPKWCKIETHNGARCLAFKEFDPSAPVKYRAFAGATRIVRLSRIHTVR